MVVKYISEWLFPEQTPICREVQLFPMKITWQIPIHLSRPSSFPLNSVILFLTLPINLVMVLLCKIHCQSYHPHPIRLWDLCWKEPHFCHPVSWYGIGSGPGLTRSDRDEGRKPRGRKKQLRIRRRCIRPRMSEATGIETLVRGSQGLGPN